MITGLLSRGSQVRVLPGAPLFATFLANRHIPSPAGSVRSRQNPSKFAWVTAWVAIHVGRRVGRMRTRCQPRSRAFLRGSFGFGIRFFDVASRLRVPRRSTLSTIEAHHEVG